VAKAIIDKPSSLREFVYTMSKTVSTRLTEEELSALDALAESSGLDRSGMTRSLVRKGLKASRLESALASYTEQRVTLSRAAEIAGLPLWDFIGQLNMAGGTIHYDVPELEEDLDDAP
jgi:predicted HTH domain antitoxin